RAGFASDANQDHGSFTPLATRQAEGADAGRIVGRAQLQVVAYIPDRAVVGGVHSGLGEVLPAQGVRLGRFAFGQNGFVQRQNTRGIAREPAGETLAREV